MLGQIFRENPVLRTWWLDPLHRQGFPEIQLAARQFGVKDGVPSISFTAAEYQAVSQRFSHTLIAKFQIGRPPFEVVKQTMLAAWKLEGRVTISSNWDDRHVVIILDSEKDVTAIVMLELEMDSLNFARACMELDVTKPIPDKGPATKCTKSITHVGQEEWVEVRRKKGARTVQFIDNNHGDKPNPTILEQAISTEVAEGEINTNGLEEEQQDSRPKDSIKKGIEITVEEVALKETNVLPGQVHVDKVVKEETSPVEKTGDLPEVGDLAGGSAHEEMREQDRGSVAEVVTATNVIPSIDSSEDYVVHTREDGSIYCDVFGGKSFQNKEELAKFARENGFVIKDVPITTIEESGKGGEDREAIRKSDNESRDDQVDSQVPVISSQQRTRHRKKKGSRPSTRSCPKKKDDDFVWP
ncbi:hypothetical protein QQ045_006608 [Rhodiola kirilowii]